MKERKSNEFSCYCKRERVSVKKQSIAIKAAHDAVDWPGPI